MNGLIEKPANGIAEHRMKSERISPEKKEVYVYGLDIILSSIWIHFLVAIISLAS